MIDPIAYYNLENFLLSEVRGRFQKNEFIEAFDFFSIIIWKSNRSKSKVANRLINKSQNLDLDRISKDITSAISKAKTEKEKMRVLIEDWKFKLPIASAILTILYPDIFTVYDYRAAEQVGEGEKLKYKTKFENIWNGYVTFRKKVAEVSYGKNLREKDQHLFGLSRIKDLKKDLKNGFSDENQEDD
jgi:hypothetical protein